MRVAGSRSKYRVVEKTVSTTCRGAWVSASLLSIAVSGAAHVQAQEQKVVLEEVVVTATRRDEGLQTIPASISALTSENLDNKGVSGFEQLSESIAGLQMSKPNNSISTGIYMRGVGTGGTSPADSSVGLIIDNVYQLRQGPAFNELLDISRVEVLRGPQGTLFGKNTTAGVIRVFTADPETASFSGRLQGVAGNLDNREVRGLLNIPLVEDVMALRASAYTAERDGHTENVFVGEDTRNVDREGWRAKLLWDVTDTFQIKVMGEHSEQFFDLDEAMSEYPPNLAANPIFANYPISIGKYQQNHMDNADETDRHAAYLYWELGDYSLSTTSSWEEVGINVFADRDRTVLQQQTMTVDTLTEVETHEIQFNSDYAGPLNFVVGYYLQKEDLDSRVNIYLGTSTTPFRTSQTLKNQESEALFSTLFYDINDEWSASLGVRYTEDTKESAPTDLWAGGDVTFDEATYSAKLMYQMTPDVMFYVAHDKGFKSGGINRNSNGACTTVLTDCSAVWDPETTFNYELGIKSVWLDNRLRLNGAIYYQTFEDFQVTQNLVAFNTVLVRNAAEAEAKGIEGDFVFLATDYLSFDGSVALNFAKYKDFDSATCLPGKPGCVNGFQDLSGETLDHAPEWTFNVGAEYRRNITDSIEGFARVDVVYRDEQNLYFELYETTEQGSYALVNARMGVEVGDSWKVTLWGNNLTDEEYLAESLEDSISKQQVPGLVRTYGVTLDWFF